MLFFKNFLGFRVRAGMFAQGARNGDLGDGMAELLFGIVTVGGN